MNLVLAVEAGDVPFERAHYHREGGGLHGFFRECGQVHGGRVMIGGVEATGIGEMGSAQFQSFCPVVHHVDKRGHFPANVEGHRLAGVVGTGHQHGRQQIMEQKFLIGLQLETWSALDEGPAVDADHLLGRSLFQRHQGGHDFGQTGRR